jgi:hypothetical protein
VKPDPVCVTRLVEHGIVGILKEFVDKSAAVVTGDLCFLAHVLSKP